MSPDVAKAPNVAGTVDCGEHAVATGCTGVVRAVDQADASAEAGSSADSHPTAQLGLASESLFSKKLKLPPLFMLQTKL